VADRTPVPSSAQRAAYPERFLPWLDDVPSAERDDDAARLQVTVAHFGTTTEQDRHELLITHKFVISWFVRHVLDAPAWRWIGLNQANCGLTIVQWDTDLPPTLVRFNDVGHIPPALRGEDSLHLLS
jgi:serine/threonine-protein phosphatase PGAM5